MTGLHTPQPPLPHPILKIFLHLKMNRYMYRHNCIILLYTWNTTLQSTILLHKRFKKKPKVFSWKASGSSGFLSTSCLDSLVRCPANKHRSFLHHNSGLSRLALLHAANGPKLLSVHTTLHLGHFSSPNEGGGDRFPTASNPLGH